MKSIELNGLPLKWVPSLKYLGFILQEDNSMELDMDSKRFSFNGKIHSLAQELHFLDPAVKMKIYEIYCQGFYGSNLWNLFGSKCDRIFKSYNVNVRQTFNVPRETHRYLIEQISENIHPKVFLSSRFVKFNSSLNNCNKISMRILSRLYEKDLRTVYGKNLAEICSSCNVSKEEITPNLVKNQMRYFPLPENEKWRIPALIDLLNVQKNQMEVQGFNNQEIHQMIEFLCTS